MPQSLIDAFVAELSLDSDNFVEGSKEAEQSLDELRAKTMVQVTGVEDSFRKIEQQFEKLGRKVFGFLSGLFGGIAIGSFLHDAVELGKRLSDLSTVTGIGVERISSLANVFERLGGAAEPVYSQLSKWAAELQLANVSSLSPEQSSLLKFLGRLNAEGINIQAHDVAGNWRDVSDIFIDVVREINRAPISEDRKRGLLQEGGFDTTISAIILKRGGDIEKVLKEQQKIYVIGEKQVSAADQLNKAMVTLSQTSKQFGETLLTELTPAMVATMRTIQRLVKYFEDVVKNKLGLSLDIDPQGLIGRLFGIGGHYTLSGDDTVTNPNRGLMFRPGIRAGRGGGGGSSVTGTAEGAQPGDTVHGHGVTDPGAFANPGETIFEPLTAKSLGSGLGGESAMFGPHMHEGLDIMAPEGTAVYATKPGRIVKAPGPDYTGRDGVIVIDHGDGTYTRYLHQRASKVVAGQKVDGGARVGSSGYRNAAHTHLELWQGEPGGRNSKLINPRSVYHWGPNNLPQGGRGVVIGEPPPGSNNLAKPQSSLPFMPSYRAVSPSNYSTTKTDITTLNVNTPNTDASGIAADIAAELKKAMKPSTFNERFDAMHGQ